MGEGGGPGWQARDSRPEQRRRGSKGVVLIKTRIPSSTQIAACISGNDVINELAILADNIADILWCS